MQNTTNKDRLVQNSFKNFELPLVSPNFKKETMNKVMFEWMNKPTYSNAKISFQSKFCIGACIFILLLTAYVFDIKHFTITSEIIKNFKFINIIKDFKLAYTAITQIPLIVFNSITSTCIIIFIDRLISYLTTKYY